MKPAFGIRFLCASLCCIAHTAFAKIVYYDDGTETVPIVRNNTIVFRFNEEVKTISQVSQFKIEPADSENPNYSVLSVSPRFSRGDSKVTFVLSSGTVVNLRLVVVPKEIVGQTDSFFDFKQAESKIESPHEAAKTTELALMKAMIAYEQAPGFKVQRVKKEVDVGDPSLRLVLDSVYLGPKFNGYVFNVYNLKKTKLSFDLTNFMWGSPNRAILSQVDDAELEAAGQSGSYTKLRVVSLPVRNTQNIFLPTAPIEKK